MSKPKAVIFDIDGTISNHDHRAHFLPHDWNSYFERMHLDEPIKPTCELLKYYLDSEKQVILLTGRTEEYRRVTVNWLVHHLRIYVSEYELFMRPNNNFYKNHEIKKKIYDEKIKPHYDIELVLDDMRSCVYMWRCLGLKCFDVGNYTIHEEMLGEV